MKNWKTWLAAIVLNILVYVIYWQLNPKTQSEFDFRGLFLLFYLITFNLALGFSIVVHNSITGKKLNPIPFLLIMLLILLISWGICSYSSSNTRLNH
jgi:hypothetical protein